MKAQTLFFLLLFFPLTLFSNPSALEKSLAQKAETFMKEHDVTALTLVCIGRENHQKFQSVFTKGMLSKKSRIPANEYSTFRLGPMTQIFTASALAYFVQEGQVSLNDPVSKFLPKSVELPTFNGHEITLGDLATHTSGLPDLPYNLSSRSSFTVSQMFRFLKNFELSRPPGTAYEYSNLGYALLSNLLTRISKKSFPNLIEQVILDPLFLKETGFSLKNDQKKRAVMGYEKGHAISPLESEKIYSVLIGAGGLYSTPQDLLTWLSFHLGKERTSLSEILPIMQHPYHSFKNFGVSLGWTISSFSPQAELYFIEGHLFGFSTFMGIVPKLDMGVILIANRGELSLDSFSKELLESMTLKSFHNRKLVP